VIPFNERKSRRRKQITHKAKVFSKSIAAVLEANEAYSSKDKFRYHFRLRMRTPSAYDFYLTIQLCPIYACSLHSYKKAATTAPNPTKPPTTPFLTAAFPVLLTWAAVPVAVPLVVGVTDLVALLTMLETLLAAEEVAAATEEVAEAAPEEMFSTAARRQISVEI